MNQLLHPLIYPMSHVAMMCRLVFETSEMVCLWRRCLRVCVLISVLCCRQRACVCVCVFHIYQFPSLINTGWLKLARLYLKQVSPRLHIQTGSLQHIEERRTERRRRQCKVTRIGKQRKGQARKEEERKVMQRRQTGP